jgi:pimeloyl-ACP methyl ester carboxylesterase
VVRHPALVRKLVLTGTGPKGGKGIDRVACTTYLDMLRAALTRSDPKEFLFFNRDAAGKPAARAFVSRLNERTVGRDAPIKVKAFQTQLKAIKKWGRSPSDDLSKITQPTLIANGDNDRMVPSVLSEALHRRIKGSELVIYPDSGHGVQKACPVVADPAVGTDSGRQVQLQGGRPGQWQHEDFPEEPCKSSQNFV